MESFLEDMEQEVDDCQDIPQEESKNSAKDGNDCPKEMEEHEGNEIIINFNEDLLCEHNSLKTADSSRKVIPQEAWSILRKYFPDSKEYPVGSSSCSICEVSFMNLFLINKIKQTFTLFFFLHMVFDDTFAIDMFSGENGKRTKSEERRQNKGETTKGRTHRFVLWKK